MAPTLVGQIHQAAAYIFTFWYILHSFQNFRWPDDIRKTVGAQNQDIIFKILYFADTGAHRFVRTDGATEWLPGVFQDPLPQVMVSAPGSTLGPLAAGAYQLQFTTGDTKRTYPLQIEEGRTTELRLD